MARDLQPNGNAGSGYCLEFILSGCSESMGACGLVRVGVAPTNKWYYNVKRR